jgi:hypothetical protein
MENEWGRWCGVVVKGRGVSEGGGRRWEEKSVEGGRELMGVK